MVSYEQLNWSRFMTKIRIQVLRRNPDPDADPGFWWTKMVKIDLFSNKYRQQTIFLLTPLMPTIEDFQGPRSKVQGPRSKLQPPPPPPKNHPALPIKTRVIIFIQDLNVGSAEISGWRENLLQRSLAVIMFRGYKRCLTYITIAANCSRYHFRPRRM